MTIGILPVTRPFGVALQEGGLMMDGVVDHPMEDVGSTNGYTGLTNSGQGTTTSQEQSVDGDYGENGEDQNGFPEEYRRLGLLPTGCCYDDRMKLHANADFGPSPHHPEDPARIESIMRTFKRAGLVYTGSDADLYYIIQNCPTKYMSLDTTTGLRTSRENPLLNSETSPKDSTKGGTRSTWGA
jgi:histone deacetylase 6